MSEMVCLICFKETDTLFTITKQDLEGILHHIKCCLDCSEFYLNESERTSLLNQIDEQCPTCPTCEENNKEGD